MQTSRPSANCRPFQLDFSTISFLIVDDQPYSRRLVRSILVAFGSREIYESGNSVEALELARTVLPNIVITDIVMPASSGLQFIIALKAQDAATRKTPVIVLSGYLTRSAMLTITKAGADEQLVKPVSPKALYAHISRVVMHMDQTKASPAILQNRQKRAAIDHKKAAGLALI
jgi:two-component system, chemotaxis family, chemotaxis protein CheY